MAKYRLCPECAARAAPEAVFCAACGVALKPIAPRGQRPALLTRSLDWGLTLVLVFAGLWGLKYWYDREVSRAADPAVSALRSMSAVQRGHLARAASACGAPDLRAKMAGMVVAQIDAALTAQHCDEIRAQIRALGLGDAGLNGAEKPPAPLDLAPLDLPPLPQTDQTPPAPLPIAPVESGAGPEISAAPAQPFAPQAPLRAGTN